MKSFKIIRRLLLLGYISFGHLSACTSPASEEISRDKKANNGRHHERMQVDVLKFEKGEKGAFNRRSAKVVFQHKGLQNGIETLYIENFGETVIRDLDFKGPGNHPNKRTVIWRCGEIMVYNHSEKSIISGFLGAPETRPNELAGYRLEDLAGAGYIQLPDESVLGRNCSVFYNDRHQTTMWVWNKLNLKKVIESIGGGIGVEMTAVSLEEDVSIPKELMLAPNNYRILN